MSIYFGHNKKKNLSLNSPTSLYLIAGILSAIVFLYTLKSFFIMSATGSVSYLLMNLSTVSNSDNIKFLSFGFLLIILSGVFLGSYLSQYIFLKNKHNQEKTISIIKYILLIYLYLIFICAFLLYPKMNFFNSNIEMQDFFTYELYRKILLSTLMLLSSMTIGIIWLLINGTTAMSNAVKELILYTSGGKNKHFSSFLGLIGFVLTGIYYYAINLAIDNSHDLKMYYTLVSLIINFIIIRILIYDAFEIENNPTYIYQNLKKNCENIFKSTKPLIRNISLSVTVLFIGMFITFFYTPNA